ncbi:hypothetical protein L6164_012956 [Bauhinia variegata]|uniref:Uncharacterized protein n=1 Tax=Bauhinia variegata TaxID=167791 RepID=A0ACB9PBN9_BAUVA|nr:hypothetical protein L6164_012956 [Bauhinia variegata]
MRVAVIGAGISGLVSAYVLAEEGANVVMYEKEDCLGGHAKTVNFDGVDLDLAFMVFNRVTYPNMMEFFETLGVDMEVSDMSFSVSLDNGRGYEWGSRKIPVCGSIWSCPSEGVLSFPAFSVLSFFRNHHLLQVKEELEEKGCQIMTSCEVRSVSTSDKGCIVHCKDGSQEMYDGCIMEVHAPDALRILGDHATPDECRILGSFQCLYR